LLAEELQTFAFNLSYFPSRVIRNTIAATEMIIGKDCIRSISQNGKQRREAL